MKRTVAFLGTVLLLLPATRAQESTIIDYADMEAQVARLRTLRALSNPNDPPAVTNQFPVTPGGNTNDWATSRTTYTPRKKAKLSLYERGARGQGAGHGMDLDGNLNHEDSVTITLPDKRVLRGHAVAIALADHTGKTVWLGQVQDCQGGLQDDTTALYPNAFSGVAADVSYRYGLLYVEQNVILKNNITISPGIDLDSARVEIWTEFYQAPAPKEVQRRVSQSVHGQPVERIDDVRIQFGLMEMVEGQAFVLPLDNSGTNQFSRFPVEKRWVQQAGRLFLVESLGYNSLAPALSKLPMQAATVRFPDGLPTQATPRWASTPFRKSLEYARAGAKGNALTGGIAFDYLLVNSALINIDFGGTAIKTGPAAVGRSADDIWNLFHDPDVVGATLANLQYSDGSPSAVSVSLDNAVAEWGATTGDPMFDTYCYRYGGSVGLTLNNLPEGIYDFYFYGHGAADDQIGIFELNSQTKSTAVGPYWNANQLAGGNFVASDHYVAFRGVQVLAGTPVSAYVRPGPSGYAIINGLQIQAATNQAPQVSAGTNQTITLPANATLVGTASDDDLPAGSSLTNTWSQVSGPGNVTFDDIHALSTTASFRAAGTYVLRLSASDSDITSQDDILITVRSSSGSTQTPHLLNINCAGGNKVGPAAYGESTNDYWNVYYLPFDWDFTISNLKWADNSGSGINLHVQNGPGCWANSTGDPMYDTYSYNEVELNMVLTLENLPGWRYDVYLYGHGAADDQPGVYQLNGQTNQTAIGPYWNNNQLAEGGFVEGEHYVVFRNVPVDAGVPLQITVLPTGSITNGFYAIINGLQIVPVGSNAPPFLSDIPDQAPLMNMACGPIGFTVGDDQTSPDNLTVTAFSSNINLIANASTNIVFGGSGATRTITLYPASAQGGTTTVTVTVSDGELTTSKSFTLTVNNSLPTDAIAWWQFNEPSGSMAQDSSGQFHVGTILGNAVRPTGIIGTALQFDGATNQVGVSNAVELQLIGDMTLAFWFQLQSYPATDWLPLIVKGDAAGSNAEFGVWIEPGGNHLRFQQISGGNAQITLDSLNAVPLNQWAHVAVTVSNNTVQMYVNGLPDAAGTRTGPPAATSNDISLGHLGGRPHLNGMLDEVRLYNRAVTLDEMQNLANPTPPAASSPPTLSEIADQTINMNASCGPLSFTVGDNWTLPQNLGMSVYSGNPVLVPNNATNLVLGGSDASRTLTITPATNQSGITVVTVTVDNGYLATNKAFTLTVNGPPTLSEIPDQAILMNMVCGPIGFTVGDDFTPAANLTVTAQSSNTALVPTVSTNIVLGGGGATRSITVYPAPGQGGTTVITVTVSDGALTTSETFTLTVNNALPTDAIAWWQFNEPSGATAQDSSGHFHPGTILGNAMRPAGIIGTALHFDGITNQIGVSNAAELQLTGDMSVAFWLQLQAYPTSDWLPLIVKGDPTESNAEFGMWIEPGSHHLRFQQITSGNAQISLDSLNAVPLNQWAHVAVTVSNNTIQMYVNGLADVAGSRTGPPAATSNDISLGHLDGRPYLNGTLDEVRLYNRVITSSEMQNLANPTPPANNPPNLSIIPNQVAPANTPCGPIRFTVGDDLTLPQNLGVSAFSANPTLVPNTVTNVVFGGWGASRTLTLTPATNQVGTALITITVNDGYHAVSETFTLTVLPAFKLWLRADAGITNTSVGRWFDQSGNHFDATQTTPGNQPILVTNVLNGLPVVRFNGSSSYFTLPNLLNGTTGAEVFVVLKAATNLPTADRTLWRLENNYSGTFHPNTAGLIVEDFGSTTSFTVGKPASPLDQFHFYNVAATTGNWQVRVNGILQASTTNSTYGTYASPLLGWNGYGNYFAGDIAELFIFGRVLNEVERDSVGVYLNSRYDLVTAVPAVPTNVVARGISSNQVSLTWSFGLGTASTTFVVERKTGTGGSYAQVGLVRDTLSFLDTNLVAGTTYVYRVQAYNVVGASGYSNEANATTPTGGVALPLGSLKLWLKADCGAGVVANQPVDWWVDQSRNFNNARQDTASKQPLWVADALNGLPVVRFNGSSACFTLPNLLNGTTGAEVFVVLKAATNLPSSDRTLWRLENNYYGTFHPSTAGMIVDDFGSTTSYTVGRPVQPLDQFHVYNVTGTTGNWQARVNGVLQAATTNSTYATYTTPLLGWNGYYNYFAGDIAELLIFGRVLSDGERDTVSVYLNARYGLVTAGPSTPSGFNAQAVSTNQINLTWRAELGTVSTAFVIERKVGAGGSYAQVAVVRDMLGYLDTNLLASTDYVYRLKACNVAGESEYSNEATAATPASGVALPVGSLKLWLKADCGTGGATNRAVDWWVDQSGCSNNARQDTPANQPLWVANTLNGMPVMRFDGVNDSFNLPNLLSGTTGAEAFVVLKAATNLPNGNRPLWKIGASGNITAYPNNSGLIVEDFASSTLYTVGKPAQPLDQFHVYNVAAAAGNWQSRVNGILQASTTNNNYVFTTVPTLGWNNPSYFAGDIAEVLIFSRILNDGERDAVSSYLNARYALVTAAPSTPANLSAQVLSSNQVSLAWSYALTASSTAFIVERQTGINGSYEQVAVMRDGLSYLDTSLSAATQYAYRVKAYNAAGESPYSNETSATTLASGASVPLGDLKLWLRADCGAGGATNRVIDWWLDQSGRYNNARQDTAANQPVWVANALNGMPIVRFNGSSSYFTLPNLLGGATGAEAYVVLKAATNLPSGYRPVWTLGNSGNYLGYPDSAGRIVEDLGSTTVKTVGVPAQPINQYHLYNVAGTAGSWVARINGMSQYALTNNTFGATATPSLGFNGAYGSHSYFAGDIAEVLIFGRVLADEEQFAVGTYLSSKYGIVTNLPAAPTNLAATGSAPGQIQLTWTAPGSLGSLRSLIERKTGSGGAYSQIGSVFNGTSFLDTTAAPGADYFYRVRVHGLGGDSPYSAETSPPAVTITSPTPGKFVVAGGNLAVEVAASDLDGSVMRIDYLLNGALAASNSVPPFSVTLTSIAEGTTNLVALALDNQGNSAYSAAISLTSPDPVPWQRQSWKRVGPKIQRDAPWTSGRLLDLPRESPHVKARGNATVAIAYLSGRHDRHHL